MEWFNNDVVNASMKALAELFPEIAPSDIVAWKDCINQDLGMLLQGILSFEDYEKRILSPLKTPKLEFDIEKPVDEKDIEEKM